MFFNELINQLLQIPQLVQHFGDWLKNNQGAITAATAILALLRPWGWIGHFRGIRRQAPQLEFGLEQDFVVSGNGTDISLKLVNAGGSAAADIRITWNQRSTCTMDPVPQPFMLLVGEQRIIHFRAESLDLVLRVDEDSPLGWLVVTYSEGGWRRRRVGRSLLLAKHQAHTDRITPDLGPLPRRAPREVFPFIGTILDAVNPPEKRQRKLQENEKRRFNYWVQDSRGSLLDHGIRLDGEHEEVLSRLLGELGSRGWEWRLEPGGRGYEIEARKTWPPSSSMTIKFDAPTSETAAVLVLAAAMREDEDRDGQHSEVLA